MKLARLSFYAKIFSQRGEYDVIGSLYIDELVGDFSILAIEDLLLSLNTIAVEFIDQFALFGLQLVYKPFSSFFFRGHSNHLVCE